MATITTLPTLRLSLLDLLDQGSLTIVDMSTYSSIPSNSNVALQITPPGWATLNVPFDPGKANVYKCADLGIICATVDCCPLPDGIYAVQYTVRYSGSLTTSINKTFIKVDQLDCRIDNLYLKVDMECDCPSDDQKKYKNDIREIRLLRDGAVAAANDCDDLKATKMYAQADKLIDRVYRKFCSACSPLPSCERCN